MLIAPYVIKILASVAMKKNKDGSVNIKLDISKELLRWCRKAARQNKMSFNDFVIYSLKVQFRRDNDLTLPENKFLLFTTKEERAWRRSNLGGGR